MIESLLAKALAELVKRGNLTVVTAKGKRLQFGDGTGEAVTIRFADTGAQIAFLYDPELRVGELFMNQRLLVEQGTIYDFLYTVLRDSQDVPPHPMFAVLDWVRYATRRLRQNNTASRARDNVHSHYDLGDELYTLFLDADWQYSCAYYEQPDITLEQAQLAKKRHIAAKLLIQPGQSVLDIGCGWGGTALYLAEVAGAGTVDGITLSDEQLKRAEARAAERGLSDRVKFRIEDYRATKGPYDRLVSVGMFEHVGIGYYKAYFENVKRLLKPDGVMLLHTIGAMKPPSSANPWLDRYIFPGGYVPSLSEMMPVIEKLGLFVTDIEILRLHYAYTLREWRTRFMANRAVAAARYDERFCRMWEFYLALSEAAFRCESIVVFQLQITHRQESVPLTRDYLLTREAELRQRESAV
jgi:cyclopropane-fatty-acyl-phospholipid synthase